MTEAVQTALIASSSAILGGLVAALTSVLLHRLEEKKALRQTYREKLERIAELVEDSNVWFCNVTSSRTIEELSSDAQCSEVRQAYVFACLYFPELREPIGAYSNSLVEVSNMLVAVFQPVGLDAGSQAARDPRYKQLCAAVLAERNQLEDRIEEEARKWTKA